jgi:prepilin-type N-terminal cleavage/methylation domain-containing protein
MRPSLTFIKQTERGFSLPELLLVIAMVSVVAGFVVVSLVRGNRAVDRTKTAVEIANYLQKARLDSIRRNPKDTSEMAQVKVFNRRSYSMAIDADGDNQLDIPLVMNLPAEQGIEMNGPFPKTFIFDGSGQTVDSLNHHVTPEPVTLSNSAGASAIKFSETGEVIVVPAVKLTAKK